MSDPGAGAPHGSHVRSAARLLLASLVLVACHRGSPPAPSEPVEAAVRRFYMGMAAEDADENRRAMEAMTPRAEDFEALYPGHGAALWAIWEPERVRLIENAPSHAPHYREVLPIGAVHAEDLRLHADPELERSLAELPAATPVLGVRIEVAGPERQRSATAFLFVNGRWVWIWNLERAAAVIAKPTLIPR